MGRCVHHRHHLSAVQGVCWSVAAEPLSLDGGRPWAGSLEVVDAAWRTQTGHLGATCPRRMGRGRCVRPARPGRGPGCNSASTLTQVLSARPPAVTRSGGGGLDGDAGSPPCCSVRQPPPMMWRRTCRTGLPVLSSEVVPPVRIPAGALSNDKGCSTEQGIAIFVRRCLLRRVEHEAPPDRRPPLPAGEEANYGRAALRLDRVRDGAGPGPRAQRGRGRPAAAALGAGRRGLLRPGQPCLPTTSLHLGGHMIRRISLLSARERRRKGATRGRSIASLQAAQCCRAGDRPAPRALAVGDRLDHNVRAAFDTGPPAPA